MLLPVGGTPTLGSDAWSLGADADQRLDVGLDLNHGAYLDGDIVRFLRLSLDDGQASFVEDGSVTLAQTPVDPTVTAGTDSQVVITWWDDTHLHVVVCWRVGSGTQVRHRRRPREAGREPVSLIASVDNGIVIALLVTRSGSIYRAARWRVPIATGFGSGIPQEDYGTLVPLGQSSTPLEATQVIPFGSDSWVVVVTDLGPAQPLHLGGGTASPSTRFTRLFRHSVQSSTSVQGRAGRGFVLDGWAYVPVAEQEPTLEATTWLWSIRPTVTSGVEAQRVQEVLTVGGTANWRPAGLWAVLMAEDDVVDPMAFDPLGFTVDDWLVDLLLGTFTPLPMVEPGRRCVVTTSVPTQPDGAPEPRLGPSYAVAVDLRASTATGVQPAVVGPKVRLGYGEVDHLAAFAGGVVMVSLTVPDGATAPDGADLEPGLEP